MVDARGFPLPAAKRQKPDPFVVSANEALTFKLLDPKGEAELRVDHEFHPEFTHQVFGADEEIKGYSGLRIDIFVSQHSFHTHVNVGYDKKQVGCENIMGKLQENFSGSIISDRQEFQNALQETPKLSKEELGQPLVTTSAADGSAISIYQSDVKKAASQVKVQTCTR